MILRTISRARMVGLCSNSAKAHQCCLVIMPQSETSLKGSRSAVLNFCSLVAQLGGGRGELDCRSDGLVHTHMQPLCKQLAGVHAWECPPLVQVELHMCMLCPIPNSHSLVVGCGLGIRDPWSR